MLCHPFPEFPGMTRIELAAVQFQDVDEKYVAFFISGIPFRVALRLVFPSTIGTLIPVRRIAIATQRIVRILELAAVWAFVNFALGLGVIMRRAQVKPRLNTPFAVLESARLCCLSLRHQFNPNQYLDRPLGGGRPTLALPPWEGGKTTRRIRFRRRPPAWRRRSRPPPR